MIDPELALEIVRNSKRIAYDTETSGLQPGKDLICGYVITDYSFSVYVPVRHKGGGNIPMVEDFEKALNDAFAERERMGYETIGHYLGFDLRFSLWQGVKVGGKMQDTAINESLIDDRTRGYSLEMCCDRHNVTAKKGAELYRAIAERFGGMPDRSSMQHFHKMPGDHPLVVDYAVGDGVSTLELADSQYALLERDELLVPWQLECDLLPYVARLHRRGMAVDMDYAARIDIDLAAQIAQKKSIFPAGFNARSPKEVEALYRANGYQDEQFAKTATGKYSFTEKWLETNEIGDALLSVRRLEKAKDSFIAPLVDTHNINGRVHPTLHQSKSDDYGVSGSRFSCSDPNMQAFPKRNKVVGKIVRPLVRADGDWLIEEADAQQQEPRFFTHYSEEPALVDGYNAGTIDIHDRANEVLFDSTDRDKAKRLGLGMLTMMSPPTLSEHMRCSLAEARVMHKAFLTDAFPAIGQFQRDVVDTFARRGYVKSILGRRARLESRKFAYQGVSRVIQNSGGDHMKTCLLRAMQYEDAYGDQIQMLMTIHDSIIWQRDPGHSPKELVAILENVPHEPQFNLIVPIPFEVGSGRNWSEASYGGNIKDKNKGWLI